MQSQPTIERTGSPVPGVILEPVRVHHDTVAAHERLAATPTTSGTSKRERHFPRVCRSCQAPMARQEDACWRCGALWVSEDAPRTTLHVIAGGAPADVAGRAIPGSLRSPTLHAPRARPAWTRIAG
jgi:hypothetical protein